MPNRKSFYKQSVSVGVLGSVLFMAGCGTTDIAEQPAESEQAEVQTTTASDGSGGTEQPEEEAEEVTEEETQEPEEDTEGAEAETAATDAEEQAVPEDQQGITMPMPLGTSLDDLIKYYGQPTYDDFFLGSQLVIFNEGEGYFFDDEDIAKGFYIANSEITVFDTRVGMTFEEVDEILGAEGEVGYDRAETQYYLNVHYVENYRITYSAETEDGPIVNIVVVRSK
ncbi:hypothetical protein AUC31_10670 [Planococcus rifietoensis]|uniref:DUF4309 domain-containing protein n=1 Tax=Planococcus rifietoensis TaxID=200991 RepID=A0A0U2YVP3_9BACL|nr:hypothetical protein [Planococcus rifietoensis]ALS75630.1 hypothetical protein AUC31_10670 [Planococcus rifietoensis]